MKINKKTPLQTLTGQSGEYQSISKGKSNNTLNKGDSILNWIYGRSIRGLRATAFDSFNHNADTSFRTHISELCHKYGLEILRECVRNSNTGTWYKEYWLSDSDIKKVKKILNK